MGEEQKLPPEEQLATARDAFEDGTDFTVAVEEEFALLDPETLGLVNRFEDVQAAARGTDLERAPRRRADRVRGRGAHRPLRRLRRGRGEDGRAPRAAPRARARAGRRRSAPPARTRGAAGRTSASSTRRTTGGTTSSSSTWSGATTPSGSTSTSGSRAATARSRSATRCGASFRAARAVGQLAVRRGGRHGPALGAHADLHAHVPALRDPGRLRRLAGVRGLRLVPLPHGLDRRAHAALVERAPAPRVSDRRDPDLRRAARPRRVAEPRRARVRTRRARARGPTTRASRCPTCRTACSRRTCGARSATASPAS